jgi:hypothetical protein
MELKEFISQSIIQIVNGIIDGHKEVRKVGALVNPRIGKKEMGTAQRNDILAGLGDNGDHINFLEFDVALIASEDTKGKGGLGVFVGAIGLGATGESVSANSQQSRLKFTIPIQFPAAFEMSNKQLEG